jgi:ribosome-associated protein
VEPSEVVDHLLKSARWAASRSSGPGGQHRDKASTRAELSLTLGSLAGLEPEVASRLAAALALDERPLRIVVQDERSLARNQDSAIERLSQLVAQALAPPAPPRRPTRPSRASRERRLAAKARRGRDKTLRRTPEDGG